MALAILSLVAVALPAIAEAIASAGGSASGLDDMFYTYVLKSTKDEQFYIGFTSDLRKRFDDHSRGLVEATKHRRPFILVYYEACLSQQKAIGREKSLKTGFGRKYLKERL